ncbi:MAG: DUF3782 domain-containing protein [Desulfobacteraceae bacterium]|nr:DUF3782 domain-containing protein [Desulfobacteraceae bacterium]
MSVLTDEELIDIFAYRLPNLLERRPELEPQLYHFFLKAFVRKEAIVALEQRVKEFQSETREHFKEVDERFDKVDERLDKTETETEIEKLRSEMSEGFSRLTTQIDRLGSRWGIRNEALFRATVTSILEKSFSATVETLDIQGEQFDIIISNGQHILVEIAASVKRNIQERLERKCRIYQDETGAVPNRVILAAAAIHSRLAESLRQSGFEVIEPEDDDTFSDM